MVLLCRNGLTIFFAFATIFVLIIILFVFERMMLMNSLTFTKMTKPADSTFTCGIESIDKMVENSYFLCLMKRSYAYEVTANGIIVAYYRIELKRFDNSKFDPPLDEHSLDLYNDLYALHIQYIAVWKEYQQHRIGTSIFEHILQSIDNIVEYCPLRLVTLEAFHDLIKWYSTYAFIDLAPSQDNPETNLMFLDLISSADFDKIQSLEEAYM